MAVHMHKYVRLSVVFSRDNTFKSIWVEERSNFQRRLFSQNNEDSKGPSPTQQATGKEDVQSGFFEKPTESNKVMVHQDPNSVKEDLKLTTDQNCKGSLAAALSKFASSELWTSKPSAPVEESFATLFRNSKFVDVRKPLLGDAKGRMIKGTIFRVVNNDLYVDFGWKFHCVVDKPAKNPELYVQGAVVLLSVKDLEMSSRFLGASTDLSLNEADCKLVSLVSSPMKRKSISK